MMREKLVAVVMAVALTGCGGGGGTSSTSDGGGTDTASTTYSGELSHSFTRTGRATMAVGTCSMTGPMNVTVDGNGNVTATTGNPTSDITVACQYLDEIYAMDWTGTATDSTFTISGTASGAHAAMSAQVSGTYTDTTADGTGYGTVTVTGASGSSWTVSTSITFHLTAQ